MPLTRSVALWFAAVVAAAAALAAVGLRALAIDADRVEERLRQQAAGMARTTAEALEAAARESAAEGRIGISFRADADGAWLDTRQWAQRVDGEPPRRYSDEIDALERAGEEARALERLDELAQREDSPTLAAWALSTTAALHARSGDEDAARRAWERVASDFGDVADGRGLRRSLAARWSLAGLDGFPAARLRELLRDLIEERIDVGQTAVGALAMEVGAKLREVDVAAFEELDALDRSRDFERRLVATWPSGISNWIASGAPGGLASFELLDDPLRGPEGEHVFVCVLPSENGFAGAAMSSSELARGALARPEIEAWRELGFEAAVATRTGRIAAGAEFAIDEDTALERLAPPFDSLTVRARSADIERARSEARLRFWMIAVVSLLALAAACVAAWLGVRALEREANLARQREQFVAAVTHELKAPLASIRLLAELLEQGDVGETRMREFGARTVAEADRLSRLISSVLEMARLERGAAPTDREEIVLRQLALETLRQFEPLALERKIAVKLHPVDESLTALASRDAIGSALFELLTNASKYGGGSSVELEFEARGDAVVLAVLDRGPGVAASERERIFEPFQRLGDEMTREQPGVGLGLALVRKVAESHGGSARCVPREGGGSRFEIELPRGRAN